MADQRWIDYIRSNQAQYPIDSLKEALRKNGVSEAEIEEAVARAAAPPPGAPARQVNPPMSWWEIARLVTFEPARFFQTMPRSGGMLDPTAFVAAMVVVSAAISFLMAQIFQTNRAAMSGPFALIAVLMFTSAASVLIPFMVFLCSIAFHGFWRLLGSRRSFETSYRTVAYTMGLYPFIKLAQGLPAVGSWFSLAGCLYSAYLLFLATREVHEIEKSKVLVAVGSLYAALAVCVGGSAYLLRQAKNKLMAAAAPQLMAPTGSPLGGMPAMLQTIAVSGPGVVATESLKAVLPKHIPGFRSPVVSSSVQGVGSGGYITSAQAVYQKEAGAGDLEIAVCDTARFAEMLAGIAGASKMNHEGPEGYKKKISGPGWTGFEEYDAAARRGSLQVLVGDRMLVKIVGNGLDASALRAGLDAVDLAAVSRLR